MPTSPLRLVWVLSSVIECREGAHNAATRGIEADRREISCRDRDLTHETWWVRRGRAALGVFYQTARHAWMPADYIDYKHDNRA